MRRKKWVISLLFLLFVLWTVPVSAKAADEYGFGESVLSWNGSVFVGSRSSVYCIQEGVVPWTTILTDATGWDFFATGSEVFFIADTSSGEYLAFYDMAAEEAYAVTEVTASARMVGRNGDKLYYLDLDDGTEYYEGLTLKSYDLSTGSIASLAVGIGKASYWNGIIVMSGMRTDAGPVQIMMMDINEKIALVDDNCVADFWTGPEGFYYFRCNMTDDISWDSVTLCTIDTDGRREVSGYAGDYIYPSVIGVPAGNSYFYFTVSSGSGTAGKAASVETGQVADVDFPESAGTPTLYRDGNTGYWYMNKKLYYWSGTQYEEVLNVGSSSDDVFLGVADGKGYYDKAGEGDSLMQVPLG